MNNSEDQFLRDWFQANKQELPDRGFTQQVRQRIHRERIPVWYYVVWTLSLSVAFLLMAWVGLFSADTWSQLFAQWSNELLRGWNMIAAINLKHTLAVGASLLCVSVVTLWVVRRE